VRRTNLCLWSSKSSVVVSMSVGLAVTSEVGRIGCDAGLGDVVINFLVAEYRWYVSCQVLRFRGLHLACTNIAATPHRGRIRSLGKGALPSYFIPWSGTDRETTALLHWAPCTTGEGSCFIEIETGYIQNIIIVKWVSLNY
jgi:hypothetical protein